MSSSSGLNVQWRTSLMPSFLLLELFIFYNSFQCGESLHDWSYDNITGNGPANWVKDYPRCGGNFQSPVDIVSPQENNNLSPLVFKGFDKVLSRPILVNNGLKAKFMSGTQATMTGGCLGTDLYDFLEFHFHWGSNDSLGSEHALEGHLFPMEGHIVGVNRKYGNLKEALKHPKGGLVMAVFIESTSTKDDSFDAIIKAVKEASQKDIFTTIKMDPGMTLQNLLPKKMTGYYCYQGSAAVPACEETVTWIVLKDTLPLSTEQIAEFRNLRYEDGTPMVNNFRPVQPLKGRTISYRGIP